MLERETATVAFCWHKAATVGWRSCYRLKLCWYWSSVDEENLLLLLTVESAVGNCWWSKSSAASFLLLTVALDSGGTAGLLLLMLLTLDCRRSTEVCCCLRWLWTAEELLLTMKIACWEELLLHKESEEWRGRGSRTRAAGVVGAASQCWWRVSCWVVDGWLRSKATGLGALLTVEMKDGLWCRKKLWLKTEIAYQGGPVKKMEKNPIWKVCGGGYQEKVTVLSWMVEFLVAMGGSLMRRRWREGQFERLYVMSKKYLKTIT